MKMSITVLALSVMIVGVSDLLSQKRIASLERQNQELRVQVSNMGSELDNLETRLNVDRESVQD